MNNQIVGAFIVGGAIIIATAMWIYFSPYQTCLRAHPDNWQNASQFCLGK